MAKEKKSKKSSVAEPTELTKATKALTNYLEENNLDPTKDWSSDKKHGKTITKLKQRIKTAKMKAKAGLVDKKEANRKPDVKPEKVKTVTKQPTSYDYPDVDGKPMTPELKKKFRSKMRALLKANMDPKDASSKALAYAMGGNKLKSIKEEAAKESKAVKVKAKKEKNTTDTKKKPSKKVKKSKKDED